MNPSEDVLSKALRELAAASAQGAPPELALRLEDEFARYHSGRRRRRAALITGLVACLALPIAWLRLAGPSHPHPATNQATLSSRAAAPPPSATKPSAETAATNVSPVARPAAEPEKASPVRARRRPGSRPATMANSFVALPMLDPAVPPGQSRLVRMEMPGSALQLIGYPITEDLLERRVVADVLVGQDGVPYAVRLVRTEVTH